MQHLFTSPLKRLLACLVRRFCVGLVCLIWASSAMAENVVPLVMNLSGVSVRTIWQASDLRSCYGTSNTAYPDSEAFTFVNVLPQSYGLQSYNKSDDTGPFRGYPLQYKSRAFRSGCQMFFSKSDVTELESTLTRLLGKPIPDNTEVSQVFFDPSLVYAPRIAQGETEEVAEQGAFSSGPSGVNVSGLTCRAYVLKTPRSGNVPTKAGYTNQSSVLKTSTAQYQCLSECTWKQKNQANNIQPKQPFFDQCTFVRSTSGQDDIYVVFNLFCDPGGILLGGQTYPRRCPIIFPYVCPNAKYEAAGDTAVDAKTGTHPKLNNGYCPGNQLQALPPAW